MAARAFGRAAVVDEEAPLAVARFERTLADGGTVWEAARAGCVHCAEAVSYTHLDVYKRQE